jgi:nitrogen fixation-related uncharacterized protein
MITFLVISALVGFIGAVLFLLFSLASIMFDDNDTLEHLKE